MEFFCELWIRWDINIPSEIFRNISKKKKKENIDRSIRLLYRTLSVSRRTNNTENGGLFGDYRPRRGRKRERGKGNYRSVCYHSPVIISLRKILCIRLICFCWNPILLKRYCNDKLNKRFKDYLSLQPSVCFIYCYCCFFFFCQMSGSCLLGDFLRAYDDLSATNLWPSFTLSTPLFSKATWERSKRTKISPRQGASKQIAR